MRYISTRGGPSAGFGDVLLGGPASDGGLYLPDVWPRIGASELRSFATLPYAEVAFRVMRPFVAGEFDDAEFRADVDAAYATFSHKDVVPLVELGADRFLLELFHGPTLAFKDVAMQLLGRLFARALKKQKRRATVIVATSGDTGSAAIAALRGLPGVDVVVLHPHGRVSEVQRRQMTTVLNSNVHNIAVEGKLRRRPEHREGAVRGYRDFAARTQLTAVNSINFARIMAQCVYYFTAAAALAGTGHAPSFVVPTGNFGDVFAGEAAARMGLPVDRLVVATNANDILARALTTGVYSAGARAADAVPVDGHPGGQQFRARSVRGREPRRSLGLRAMQEFAGARHSRSQSRSCKDLQRRYLAASGNDAETKAAIARVRERFGLVIDPHTAVGVAAADKLSGPLKGPVVLLATAHPAKFPEAIAQAIGIITEIPPKLAGIMSLEERYTVLPNEVGAVRTFVLERTGTS